MQTLHIKSQYWQRLYVVQQLQDTCEMFFIDLIFSVPSHYSAIGELAKANIIQNINTQLKGYKVII